MNRAVETILDERRKLGWAQRGLPRQRLLQERHLCWPFSSSVQRHEE